MVFWKKAERIERLSHKPEPNYNQMFFEIRNQTRPKPNQTQKNSRNFQN
jgi:hypothetical protein